MAITTGLERYREIEMLGAGGMATVVLAEDSVLGRRVALKRLSTAADPSGLSRLRREALVGASMSHPNLVSIYDVITTEDGEIVIAMEYVPGENLRTALAREGRLPPNQGLRVLESVAAGLDAIHGQGIVHRDVKPANVLLGTDGAVKLADLGIASVPGRTRITTVGTILGSFGYMAPEQLEDGPVTLAIDIYALAAVAFETLSGRKARTESNPLAVAHAIATQPPPDLREAWSQAPEAAADVLHRGMARDPGQRPGSAGELIRELRSALEPLLNAQPGPRTAVTELAAGAAAAAAAAAARPRPGAPAPGPRAPAPAAPASAASAAPASAASAAPARPRPAADRGAPPRRQPSRAWPVAALILLVVGAGIALALALSSGGSTPHTAGPGAAALHRSSTHRSRTAKHTSSGATAGTSSTSSTSSNPANSGSTGTASTGVTSTGTSTGGAPATSGSGAGSPVAAVQTFYADSAAHNYPAGWALADPTFRSQLQGYNSYVAGQQGDRAIVFHSARVVSQSPGSAVVAIETTSYRTDGTKQCSGTVQTRQLGGGGWLVHLISINCS